MGSSPVAVTYSSDFAPASSKEFLDIQANYRVWIHSETRMWHDKNIQTTEYFIGYVSLIMLNISFRAICKLFMSITDRNEKKFKNL